MLQHLGRSVLVLLVLVGCAGPAPTVDRVTILNPTDYDIDVDVTGSGRDGWLPLAIVEHGSARVVREVIDQGARWTFRFLHEGDEVGEISVARTELERDGWRVEIPAEIGEQLRDLGTPPPL
jgi:hypothetical protein